LRARDARALILFLVDVVGFEETAVHGDGDVVHHAQLSGRGGGIMLGSDREGGGSCRPAFGAYVVVDEPAAVRARRSGGRRRHPQACRHRYGSREFALRDPEGNLWSFGTYRGEPVRRARPELQ
jgi:uncharacterized glyoxalase superfamily protein PhnB